MSKEEKDMATATLELTDKEHPSNDGLDVKFYGKMTVQPFQDGVEITIREIGPYETNQTAFVALTAEQVQVLKDFLTKEEN